MSDRSRRGLRRLNSYCGRSAYLVSFRFPKRFGPSVVTFPKSPYNRIMSNTARPISPDDDAAAFLEAVEKGIADADARRTAPYEDVRRWLLSWGTENELPPPECP